jgi:hypothetical protein
MIQQPVVVEVAVLGLLVVLEQLLLVVLEEQDQQALSLVHL